MSEDTLPTEVSLTELAKETDEELALHPADEPPNVIEDGDPDVEVLDAPDPEEVPVDTKKES